MATHKRGHFFNPIGDSNSKTVVKVSGLAAAYDHPLDRCSADDCHKVIPSTRRYDAKFCSTKCQTRQARRRYAKLHAQDV